MTFERILFLFF